MVIPACPFPTGTAGFKTYFPGRDENRYHADQSSRKVFFGSLSPNHFQTVC